MTATAQLVQAEAEASSDAGEVTHLVCCDPDLAMCGTDMSDAQWTDAEGVDCVVCADLLWEPCTDPHCPDRERP